MRAINVSTGVYAAIWSQHEPGEENEDAILRRILRVAEDAPATPEPIASPGANGVGLRDERNGINFPEGFEIYRNYKGTTYRARATGGKWLLLIDNCQYASLHKLSSAVVNGPENAWWAWRFQQPDGREGPIANLRDPSKIITRS